MRKVDHNTGSQSYVIPSRLVMKELHFPSQGNVKKFRQKFLWLSQKKVVATSSRPPLRHVPLASTAGTRLSRKCSVLCRGLDRGLNSGCLFLAFGGGGGHSGRVVTLASHLRGRGSVPGTASSGKAGSCLLLVGSLQCRTLDTPTVCTGFLRPSNYPS